MRRVYIAGIGDCLPGEPVSNDDLVARGLDTSDDWIRSRSGIMSRHLALPEQTTTDLAHLAALKALANAGLSANELDLIIVATTTPEMIFPSTAALLQRRLGQVGAAAFDVQAVCSGFVYALAIASTLIKSGNHQRALVVGAETFSRLLDWSDRSTSVLFGDGAGAVVLCASDDVSHGDVLATALHADGGGSDLLLVAGAVHHGTVVGDPFVRMDGQGVFKFAVRVLAETAVECCRLAKLSMSTVDWLIPHQANVRILDATAKKLGFPTDRVVMTLDHHGNTSAASIPLALAEMVGKGVIKRGDRLLLLGVGGGFTWGGVLLDF